MEKEARSQAALEFLTTYAWAFVAIMITVAALYYFGVFNFSKFLPQKCTFPLQFECLDFGFAGSSPYGEANDAIKLKLINNIGEKIKVTGFSVINDAASPLTCSLSSPAVPFDWEEDLEKDITFANCQNGGFLTGERAEAKITMKYCATATSGCLYPCVPASGCPEHTTNGKIIALVNAP